LTVSRHGITRVLDDGVLLLSVVIARTHDIRIIIKIRVIVLRRIIVHPIYAIVFPFYFNLCRRLIIVAIPSLSILPIRPQSGSTIDVFGYLNLRRRSAISIRLSMLLARIIIIHLFSVRKIVNVIFIVYLLDLVRTHLLKV